MPELAGQTTDWIELMRAGDQNARRQLVEHCCERLRGLARKMLCRFPDVRRWEETDDVFVEAVTKLYGALETVQPESAKHFYNLAATQIRRVLIDLSRHYCGPKGIGSHHDTETWKRKDDTPPRYDRADVSREPVNLMEWTEFHEQVEALPLEEREVFNLLWYQQLSHEQAAQVLGLTTRTIRRRWRDARYRLCKARLDEPLPSE
jgi:RNA polymerase sigma factor (sigma-70 family)